MAKSFEEIKQLEITARDDHNRKYNKYFAGQLVLLLAIAISGFIHSFAQSEAVKGTWYENPHLLFWSGVFSVGLPVIVGVVTPIVAKQKAKRDFHTMMVGKLDRNHFKTPEDADRLIRQYFNDWA